MYKIIGNNKPSFEKKIRSGVKHWFQSPSWQGGFLLQSSYKLVLKALPEIFNSKPGSVQKRQRTKANKASRNENV